MTCEIVFRNIRKDYKDGQGRLKGPQYRAVPVSTALINQINLAFDLSQCTSSQLDGHLWTMCRATARRMVKRVMTRAGITGPQATPKGIRYSFGIAMVTGPNPLSLNELRKLMGYSKTHKLHRYNVKKFI